MNLVNCTFQISNTGRQMSNYSLAGLPQKTLKIFSVVRWRVIATASVMVMFFASLSVADSVSLRKVDVPIRHVDYRFALKKEESGLHRFDWKTFKDCSDNGM